MTKQQVGIIAVAILLIVAAIGWYVWTSRPAVSEPLEPETQTQEQKGFGAEISEQSNTPLSQNVPDTSPFESSNPLQNVETNPFKNAYKNPFGQ